MTVAEKTYYQEGKVTVTETRLVMGDTTYYVHNITSVKKKGTEHRQSRKVVKQNQRNFGIILALVCVAFGMICFIATVLEWATVASLATYGGALFFLAAFVVYLSATVTEYDTYYLYQIIISSAAGETEFLTTNSQQTADAVASAIDEALADYARR